MIDRTRQHTQLLLPSSNDVERSPATKALEKLSFLPRRERQHQHQHPHKQNGGSVALKQLPTSPWAAAAVDDDDDDDDNWCSSSELYKQRNQVFDMSALYNASQRVEGCMEFPPIQWAGEEVQDSNRGVSSFVSQARSSSYTDAFLGASDTVSPLIRSHSTSFLGKRQRHSKTSSSSNHHAHRLVRSIALDANLSSLLDSTAPTTSSMSAYKNATFDNVSATTTTTTSPRSHHHSHHHKATSARLEECMKILKESDIMHQQQSLQSQTSPGCSRHHSQFKKQRSSGSFQNLVQQD